MGKDTGTKIVKDLVTENDQGEKVVKEIRMTFDNSPLEEVLEIELASPWDKLDVVQRFLENVSFTPVILGATAYVVASLIFGQISPVADWVVAGIVAAQTYTTLMLRHVMSLKKYKRKSK